MQNLGRENLKWGAVVGEMEIGVRMEARGNFKYTRMKRYLCISWNIPLSVFQVKQFFVCDVLVRVKMSLGKVRKCFFSITKVLSCFKFVCIMTSCSVVTTAMLCVDLNWVFLNYIFSFIQKKKTPGPRSCRYATLENLIDKKFK